MFLSEANIALVYRLVVNKLTQSGKRVDNAVFYPTFWGIAKSLYPRLRHLQLSQQNEHLANLVLNRAINTTPTGIPRDQPEINERHDREDNSDIESKLHEAIKLREDAPQTDGNISNHNPVDSNEPRAMEMQHYQTPKTQSNVYKRKRRTVLCTVGVNKINARNVVSIQLTSAVVPNTEYTISKRNNRLFFNESSTEETWKMVEIDEGDYGSVKDILTVLVSALNMKGKCRYRYVIENQTGRLTLFSSYREVSSTTADVEQLPRLPGGENAQYIPDTFQLCFGSSDLYSEQTRHLGKILGFDSPQVYTGITSAGTDERAIQSTHPAMLHTPDAVIVRFDEIPDIALLVPLHSQKGKGYFYCPKYTHRVQVGHYKNLPTHEHFLPNIGTLTLSLTTTKNEYFDLHGATPAIEVEIEYVNNEINRNR